MRIIRGKYKGRHIPTPTNFKARPTTDFAKEGLFNILENVYVDFDEKPKALDLFGGTGSIGLEFLSRGCSKVVSVEKDFKHWQFLNRVARELGGRGWIPVHGDVFKYTKSCKEQYDIIFADPPYALDNLGDLPKVILEDNDLLAPDGIFILEHGKDYDFSQHPMLIDHRNYGSVNFSFFKKKEEQDTVSTNKEELSSDGED